MRCRRRESNPSLLFIGKSSGLQPFVALRYPHWYPHPGAAVTLHGHHGKGGTRSREYIRLWVFHHAPVTLPPRPPPFHGGSRGSNPCGDAIEIMALRVFSFRLIRQSGRQLADSASAPGRARTVVVRRSMQRAGQAWPSAAALLFLPYAISAARSPRNGEQRAPPSREECLRERNCAERQCGC